MNKSKIRVVSGVLVAILAFASSLFADDVSFKLHNYEIILPGKPSSHQKFAADELGRFLKRVFTKDIVLNGHTDRIRFFIGLSDKATKSGFTDNLLTAKSEFGVFRKERDFLLYGHDDNVPPLGKGGSQYGNTGTILSVYYFITQYVQVDFLFPGEHGVFIKPNPQITFKKTADISEPSFSVRSFFVDSRTREKEFTASERRLFRKRMLCSMPLWTGDGGIYLFYDWKKRFWKTHPEYFAIKDGKRRFRYRTTSNPCFPNEDVIRQTAEDLIARFKRTKCRSIELFADNLYWACECDKCGGSKARTFDEKRTGHSEEYYTFVAKVAGLVLKELPDKNLVTHTKRQRYYQWPPQNIKLDPRVAVWILTNRNDMTPYSAMPHSLNVMRAWKKTGRKIYLKDYCRLVPLQDFPIIWHKYTAEFIRKVYGLTDGIYSSDLWKSPYAFSALNNYVQGKLLFDKDQDVDVLTRQFIAHAYPGAEKEMYTFYEEMERILMSKKVYRRDALLDIYLFENLEKPMKLLRKANDNISGDKFLFNKLYSAFGTFYNLSKKKTSFFCAKKRLKSFSLSPAKFAHLPQNAYAAYTANTLVYGKTTLVEDEQTQNGITVCAKLTDRAIAGLDGNALKWDMHDHTKPATGKEPTIKYLKLDKIIPSAGYLWYKLGTYCINENSFLWIYGVNLAIELNDVRDPLNPSGEYDIWARIKFEGPAFHHGGKDKKNAISIEWVVAVKAGKR